MVAGGPAAGGLDDQPAALREQILAGLGLELPPDRVRTLHQRRVGLAFADRLAGDARVPVGRAVDVRRRESIDADGADPAPGELVEGRRAGGAEADDGHVIRAHGRSLLPCDGDPGPLLQRRSEGRLASAHDPGQPPGPELRARHRPRRLRARSPRLRDRSPAPKPAARSRRASWSTSAAATARSPSRWRCATPTPGCGRSTSTAARSTSARATPSAPARATWSPPNRTRSPTASGSRPCTPTRRSGSASRRSTSCCSPGSAGSSPDAVATLVVQRHLGADSLAAWLTGLGHRVERVRSKGGYRILEVHAAAGSSAS